MAGRLSPVPIARDECRCELLRPVLQKVAHTDKTKWNDFDQVGEKADRRCTPDVGFYFRSTELSVITYG